MCKTANLQDMQETAALWVGFDQDKEDTADAALVEYERHKEGCDTCEG